VNIMRKFSTMIVVTGLLGLTLAGCGNSPGCRALTGAGIGAAGGAIIGALAGSPAIGAAAGGAAGAAAGGLTSSDQVNLGNAPCD
jgi:osmotically inducible lipoprotein OsmB